MAVVAVSAALRFYKLGEWSYWSDEAFTISDSNAWYHPSAMRLPEHGLAFRIYGAFFEQVRAGGRVLDEWTVRLLPAVFGIVGVASVALLGARPAGRKGALFAALIVAISPFHLYWSQNARSYALEIVLALPAALMLGSSMLSGKLLEFAAGAILLTGAAFAHPTALTLLPGLFIFGAGARLLKSNETHIPWKWVWLVLVAGAAVIFLSPLRRSIWVHFQVKSGASPQLFISTVVYYFRPALLAAGAVLGLRGLLRRDVRSLFFVSLSFGTIAAGFAASCLVRANSQYVVAAFPFLALLVGRELVHLAWSGLQGAKLASVAFAVTLLADFAGGAFLYFGPERGHRAPWRDACAFVAIRRNPGDSVAATQAAIVECYLNPANPLPREITSAVYLGPFEPQKFEGITKLRRRAWFMVLDVDLAEWAPVDRERFQEFLREHCRAVAQWSLQFGGKDQTLRVWRFDVE